MSIKRIVSTIVSKEVAGILTIAAGILIIAKSFLKINR